jgi:hypothetical protein
VIKTSNKQRKKPANLEHKKHADNADETEYRSFFFTTKVHKCSSQRNTKKKIILNYTNQTNQSSDKKINKYNINYIKSIRNGKKKIKFQTEFTEK